MTLIRRIPLLLSCLIAGLVPAVAIAHVTATGVAAVEVNGRDVSYRLTVVPSELSEEAARLVSRAAGGSRPDAELLAEQIRRAVVIRVDGKPCRAGRVAVQDVSVGLKTLLDYSLYCPAEPGRLELEEDWAGLFGEHYQTIVTIRSAAGGGEYLLGQGTAAVSVDIGAQHPRGFTGFVRLGMEHILTGYDHLLFLFALLAGAANFWQVLGIASMFTIAHSITLSLAVLELVHAPSAVVEPLIAVSIIWVAIENLLGAGDLWRRLAVTFVFGLVHGLGFADALSPLALTGWPLVDALAGFNLGVELGQIIAIALVLPVMLVISRLTAPVLIYRYASLAVAAAGAYWLVERVGFE
jgi:hypothetical protein